MTRGTLAIALLVFGFSSGAWAQQARVGGEAPEIKEVTILNSDQSTVTLKELRGKVVILEFWATWCGPCIHTGEYLDGLQEQFGDKLQVVSLSDEDQSTVSRFLNRRPSSAMVGVYEGYSVGRSYPHDAIPHGILIDTEGRIVKIGHPMGFSAEKIEEVYAREHKVPGRSGSTTRVGGNKSGKKSD
ncbi:MAG: TlpA disulfide reductase family protein [Bacteroidota bacterium]